MPSSLDTYPLRAEARAVCYAAGIAGLAGGLWSAAAALMGASPIWFAAAFQLLVAVAGFFCLLLGRGRFTEAPALALLSCAGTMLVGGLLSEVTRLSALGITSVGPRALAMSACAAAFMGALCAALVLIGLSMVRRRPASATLAALAAAAVWVIATALAAVLSSRLAPGAKQVRPWDPVLLGGILLGCSASAVLVRRQAGSLRDLAIGGALAAAAVAVVAGSFATRGAISQMGGMIAGIILLLVFFLVLGLASAATHLVVRAFERGR